MVITVSFRIVSVCVFRGLRHLLLIVQMLGEGGEGGGGS